MNRRSFLTSVASAAGFAGTFRAVPAQARQAAAGARSQPSLRVAQLSDTHVFQDLNCPAHMRTFLERFRTVTRSPDLVLHTGDVIYDALEADRDAVARQWALWQEIARDLPSPPMYAIGNHDVWGRGAASDPLDGKKWATEALKLPNRFYTFTKGGWKFIVLDSVHAIPGGWYAAQLDEEQLSWLGAELDSTPVSTLVAIVSHIPILSVAFFDWAASEEDVWSRRVRLMHTDSRAIQAVLRRHPNVKLCISGHLHLLDQSVYDGITYLGCGAVSGDVWQQPVFHQTPCGFATIDLFADGSFGRTYHPYDW